MVGVSDRSSTASVNSPHDQTMIPKKMVLIKTFMLTVLVLMSVNESSRGDENGFCFKDQLYLDTTLHFEHRHVDRNEVTGHTRLRYETVILDGQTYLAESHQNSHSDGTVFSQKRVYFDPGTGRLSSYTETDFRSDVTIHNTVADGQIITRVEEGDRQKEIKTAADEDLVLFETLTLSLRQMLPDLLNQKNTHFTLYLPVVAIELEKKHLPLSLSKLRMNIKVEAQGETETPYGRQPYVQLMLEPASFLISSLLPKEKSEFRFRFIAQPPVHLIAFEEGGTRSVLTAVEKTSE
jgi:hypothetical protein